MRRHNRRMLPGDRQEQIVIRQVRLEGRTVWLDVQAAAGRAPCLSCGGLAAKIHDRYRRCPRDVPWRGPSVAKPAPGWREVWACR